MMRRAFNFCAGPASLPTAVLEKAQRELLDWQGRGVSVMEVSHRSAPFLEVAQQSEQRLRALLEIPDDYDVLFMQGGASAQFSLIPLNLRGRYNKAAYIETGHWSAKAIAVARQYLEVEVIASTEGERFCRAPTQAELVLEEGFDYVHYTPNETIGGVAFDYIPDTQDIPLVADFSSSILSEPLDVSRFDLIYAGAQKNIGPSGLCLVIVKRSWLSQTTPDKTLPEVFNYARVAQQGSMLNTPPTFAWYLSGLVFEWLTELGGLEVIAELNKRKAAKLYQYIDQSGLYSNPIVSQNRSRMNVPFTLQEVEWESAFLAGAEQRHLLNLKGHRSVGGMRASLYNAVSLAAVDALVDYMKLFERERLG